MNESTISMRMIPPQCVVDVVRLYRPMFATALAAACETDARACVTDLVIGRRQLWGVFHGDTPGLLAMFRSEISIEPDGSRVLVLSALAGKGMRAWVHIISDGMVDVARSIGCTAVRFAGRAAWGRVLPEVQRIGELRNGHAVFERRA